MVGAGVHDVNGVQENAIRQRREKMSEGMIDLYAIRNAGGLTQAELASRLGIGQASVSVMERRSGMWISTMANFVLAAGADSVEVVVNINGRRLVYPLEYR
jgi:transcriptional regulator with XRE-family HTH domain